MGHLTFAQYGRSCWSAYDNGRFVAMGRTKREAKAKASAIEAAAAVETVKQGSTEGESAGPQGRRP